MIEKIYELPSSRPVRSELLQRISRLSGAYVENHGNRGKVLPDLNFMASCLLSYRSAYVPRILVISLLPKSYC